MLFLVLKLDPMPSKSSWVVCKLLLLLDPGNFLVESIDLGAEVKPRAQGLNPAQRGMVSNPALTFEPSNSFNSIPFQSSLVSPSLGYVLLGV